MTQPFTAAAHYDVLGLLVQVAVLLLTARVFGELAQRWGQPAVVGELLAGIVLGPTLLSGMFPAVGALILPQTRVQGSLLEVVSLLGAMFLMLITGLETDLTLIRRHARTAIGVSVGGILTTFSSGLLLGLSLPDDLLIDPDKRLVFALFVATAMSISAIPVIAKVLMDLNLLRRDVGQTIIAAGMSDDTMGWIMLSIVAGLASGASVEASTLLRAVGNVAIFMGLSFTVGHWVVQRSIPWVQNHVISRDKVLSVLVLGMFVWGAFSLALGLEAVLGALVVGILFGRVSSLNVEVIRRLESIALGIFTPIFFAVAGLKVDLRPLLDLRTFMMALLVIAVACVGKIAGTYLGARLIGGRDHWTALSYGAGLNARGAMEIIVATIGLSLGILTQTMFSIIVLMAMVTSLMAPTALRWVLARVATNPEEQRRLEQEALRATNLVSNLRRVLLPVRVRPSEGGSGQSVAARILERLSAHTPLSITLLTVTQPETALQSDRFLAALGGLFPHQQLTYKVIHGDDLGDIILNEAQNDYDLLVLGAPQSEDQRGTIFTPMVDRVVRLAPCPTLLIHGQQLPADWMPRRILVPTNGSVEARHAAEVAFALCTTGEEVVDLLTVIEELTDAHHLDASGAVLARQLHAGQLIVKELAELGAAFGVSTSGAVLVGTSPESLILQHAATAECDLIILGTSVRPASDHLYLGPRVERMLRNATCPVIVVNT